MKTTHRHHPNVRRYSRSFPHRFFIITTYLDDSGMYRFHVTDGEAFLYCNMTFTFRWLARRHARKWIDETFES